LNDKFRIIIEIKKSNGESIVPKSITGDLGDNIKPGNNKIIIWDLGKDGFYLNEEITFEIFGEKQSQNFSRSSIVLMSVVLPGLGQTKMTSKPYWLGGVAAYGALAGGYIFYKSSLDTYELYDSEINDPLKREDLWNHVQKKYNISNILFISAATIWISNIIWASIAPISNQPGKYARLQLEPVVDPYYRGALVSLRIDF
jgi:hypothetical protein